MKTAEFNKKFELDRKSRGGVRANPKHAAAKSVPEIMTADSTIYDASQTYISSTSRRGKSGSRSDSGATMIIFARSD